MSARPSRTRLVVFCVFVMALGVWTGGAVFDTLSGHPPWWADPVGVVRAPPPPAVAAPVNPWPVTTALLGLTTLAALAAFARYRGPGRREVLLVLGGVVGVLAVTGAYFVPELIRLAEPAALSDAEIVAASRAWIAWNAVRLAALLVLQGGSLAALVRIVRPPS